MNRKIGLIGVLSVIVLACGITPLPKSDPARFDYHEYLTPVVYIATPTPSQIVTPAPTVAPRVNGGKGRDWKP